MKNKDIKRERFVRIVERRVGKILDDLEGLSKCSNRTNYEYSEADINKVFNAIKAKLREVKILFKVPVRRR